MQKQGRFNLAISYNNFLTLDKENSPRNERKAQLFMQETPIRYSIDQFIRNKPYEVVGVKELKPFRNRLRKLEKMNPKWGFGRSTRRMSEVGGGEKQELLGRGEVIQCLSHAMKSQVAMDGCKEEKTGSMNSIVLRGENRLNVGHTYAPVFGNPSVSQIKARMRTFQAQWTKKALQILALPANSREKSSKSKRAKERRSHEKDKEETLSNRTSELWRQTLRNTTSLADLSKKKPIVVIRDDRCIIAKGQSKFKSQTQWLDLKCQQGYRFKLSPHPTKRML